MTDRPDLSGYSSAAANSQRRPGPPQETDRDPVDPAPTQGVEVPAPAARQAGRLVAEPTVQLNTRISLTARDQLNELVTNWSGSNQGTIRNVIEDLIDTAYSRRAS